MKTTLSQMIDIKNRVRVHDAKLVRGELGLAMLMATDGDEFNEPVAVTGSLSEALELSDSDMRTRDPNTDTCPSYYRLFVRNSIGRYTLAASWEAI